MSSVANAIHQAIHAPSAPVNRPSSLVETVPEGPFCEDAERGDEAGANEDQALDTVGRRIFWELRHARLRLALAENDIAWAQELLVSRGIGPGVALRILDEVFEDLAGVRP
jgi:hypothetical protein